ncbi:MAG: TatD family hydrolase [Spirochaetota bacterium]
MRVFTDSHAHLRQAAREGGEEAMSGILAAYMAEPSAILLDIGTGSLDLGERIAEMARLSGGVLPGGLRFSAGLWPGKPSLDRPEAALAELVASIEAASREGVRVAAIGEGGFDFHHMEADPSIQAFLFSLQSGLAARLGLPLLVHSREAFAQTLAAIGSLAREVPVIIHCFGYGTAEAQAFLDSGCHLSFAGNLTYKKSSALREALALVPDDRLLLETDAPYMNPDPSRGKPSSPLDIGRTYAVAAAIRGMSVDALAALVSANALRLFP